MTEKVKITTYLCSILIKGISIEAYSGNLPGIELTGDLLNAKVQAKLWPKKQIPGCKLAAGKIIAKLCPADEDSCPYDISGARLTWRRRSQEILGAFWWEAPEYGSDPYVRITYNNPDQCHWVKSGVWIDSPHKKLFGYTLVSSGPGPIPIPDDKAKVFSGGGETTHTRISDFAVPGDLLKLAWHFHNTESLNLAWVADSNYYTPALTGGEITEVIGSYGDIGIKYKVRLQGIEFECVPTDFAEYEVGDWVYVLKTVSASAFLCDRPPGYGDFEKIADKIFDTPLLDLVNKKREKNGLGHLHLNQLLCKAATRHIIDMASHDFCEHIGSDGSDPKKRIKDTGYFKGIDEDPPPPDTAWGENIACGQETNNDVFTAWWSSPPHRANILNATFKEMGSSTLLLEENKRYWCQIFGYNSDHDAQPDEEIPVGSTAFVIIPFVINGIGPS